MSRSAGKLPSGDAQPGEIAAIDLVRTLLWRAVMRGLARRLLVVVGIAVPAALVIDALAGATTADAAGCNFGPNLLSSPTPRLGCAVVLAQSHYQGGAEPTLRVIRDTDNLDVTGAITREAREVAMAYYQLDCDGLVVGETQTTTPFDIYTIELSTKAQAGDMLLVEGVTSPILPADPSTPCDALLEPSASCNLMADSCHYDYDPMGDDTASAGCMNAGGASGGGSLLVVLAAFAIARRR